VNNSMNDLTPHSSLLTRRELAAALRISLRTVGTLVATRAIECIRLGEGRRAHVRFTAEAVEKYKAAHTKTVVVAR
jgi:excisionase family DNA binding protein